MHGRQAGDLSSQDNRGDPGLPMKHPDRKMTEEGRTGTEKACNKKTKQLWT